MVILLYSESHIIPLALIETSFAGSSLGGSSEVLYKLTLASTLLEIYGNFQRKSYKNVMALTLGCFLLLYFTLFDFLLHCYERLTMSYHMVSLFFPQMIVNSAFTSLWFPFLLFPNDFLFCCWVYQVTNVSPLQFLPIIFGYCFLALHESQYMVVEYSKRNKWG